MIIPITNGLWQQLKFDDNFNEISYVDNRGNSYEFSDPIKKILKFYKSNDVNINQELLDNIKYIKYYNPNEQLFVKLFSDLRLEADFHKFPPQLLLRNISENGIIAEYDLKSRYVYITYKGIWSVFDIEENWSYYQIQMFIRVMLARHLGLANTTPYTTHYIGSNS